MLAPLRKKLMEAASKWRQLRDYGGRGVLRKRMRPLTGPSFHLLRIFTKFEVFLHLEIERITELESLPFWKLQFPQVFLFQVQFLSFAPFRSKVPRQWTQQDINPSTVF